MQRFKQLNKRLSAIAELVRDGTNVCDVGTDHAFLPCYLARSGRCGKIYASDLNPNPLKIAAAEIKKQNVDVTLLQSDGLEQIPPCDDVIIAGMGGELIAEIIKKMPPHFKTANLRLITQPMTRHEELRSGLKQAGFEIINERIVPENKRSFTIIYAKAKQEISPKDGLCSSDGRILTSDKAKQEIKEYSMIKVRDIYNYLDKIAPFKNADKTDNCGLIVGDMNADVKRILVALDVTNRVASEAAKNGVDLIVTHHPLMYRPIQRVAKDDPLYSLIQSEISFIAAHTNIDVADGGTSDLMLSRLRLSPSKIVLDPCNPDGTGYGKISELDTPIPAKELAQRCKSGFGNTVVRYVDSGRPIKRVAVCSGGAGDLAQKALNLKCDAYITGDIRWDRLVFAADYGLTLVDAGHFHTENIFCEDIVKRLSCEFPSCHVKTAINSVDVCDYVI